MIKLTHSPSKRIVISGLIAIATIVGSDTISPAQSTTTPIGEVSSRPINSPNSPISSSWLRRKFMKEQLNKILLNPNHPLSCLVDRASGKWKSRRPDTEDIGVQSGHAESRWGLDPHQVETVAVEDAYDNQVAARSEHPSKGAIFTKSVIEIGGVPVMRHSAETWEKIGCLPKGTVQNAPSHPGYSAYTRMTPFAERSTPDNADSSIEETGPLSKLLSGSESDRATKFASSASSAPGGIDFSTLELRYLSEASGPFGDRGLRYAFNGTPAAHNKNLNAGRTAAVQASDAFFVWLSLSPDKFWVNLNPDEPDRIIDPQLGKTDAGRILLQADLRMKKSVAQLIHPDTALGKQFWQQLNRDGSRSCLSFRQWIVPAPATIREDGDGIYIADAPLNVKLESQYFKAKGLSGFLSSCSTQNKSIEEHNESIYRKLILPRIEQAVNKSPEYADLRRVYRSRVAAEWYRQRSTSQATNYREMVNQGDISSWPARQDWSSRQVFNQYVASITKGEFHVVHSHKWQEGNMIYTQKNLYIYGGVDFTKVLFKKLSSTDFQEKWGDLRQVVDNSLKSPVADRYGKIWLGGSTTTGKAFWKSIWFYLVLSALVVPFLILWRSRSLRSS